MTTLTDCNIGAKIDLEGRDLFITRLVEKRWYRFIRPLGHIIPLPNWLRFKLSSVVYKYCYKTVKEKFIIRHVESGTVLRIKHVGTEDTTKES